MCYSTRGSSPYRILPPQQKETGKDRKRTRERKRERANEKETEEPEEATVSLFLWPYGGPRKQGVSSRAKYPCIGPRRVLHDPGLRTQGYLADKKAPIPTGLSPDRMHRPTVGS